PTPRAGHWRASPLRISGGTSAARAKHRHGGFDGYLGDVGYVAALLDGDGDEFAQAGEQHDGELAGWWPDAGGAQLRGVGEHRSGPAAPFGHPARQLPGVVAERWALTDPAQREGRLGLRAGQPGLDRLPYLNAPRRVRVDRGRDLAHHLRVGLLQQRDEAG